MIVAVSSFIREKTRGGLVTKGAITEPGEDEPERVNGVCGFTALNTHFFPLTHRHVDVDPTTCDEDFFFLRATRIENGEITRVNYSSILPRGESKAARIFEAAKVRL